MKTKITQCFSLLCVLIGLPAMLFSQGINVGSAAYVKTTGAAYIVVNNANVANNGNWSNSGTGKLTMSGSVPAVFSGTGSTTMYDILLSNTGGITHKLTQINAHNLDISSTSALTIDTCKAMICSNVVNNQAGEAGIYINSSTERANGTLVFHNDVSSPVSATIEMYTKASKATNYKWQFFGIPLRSVAISPTCDGSYIRKFNEAGWYAGFNSTNLWIQQPASATLTSFTGYEITQLNPKTLVFSGQLENSDFSSGKLSVSSPEVSQYPGQHLFGNPYTGAIDITKIQFGSSNPGIIENTIYLYNTGSYAEWQSFNSSNNQNGSSPGQYVCIPQNQAGNGGIPAQIPSMQAFLVYAKSDNAAANIVIPYSSVGTVVRNTDMQRVRKLKNDLPASKTYTIIDVVGSRYSDRMWIFTEPSCTKAFDNGWDGYKYIGSSSNVPQLWSMETSGDYQVNSTNSIDSTTIGFIPGEDSDYHLVFTNQNTETAYPGLYLVDLVTHSIADVSQNGATYNFTATQATADNSRFVLYKKRSTASLSLGLPTIIVNGTLQAVHTMYSEASPTAATITVSGKNLTHDITLTAPAGYEISKTSASTGYAATQTLSQSGGDVAETTIYVRLAAGVAAGTYSGDISCISADAYTVNVPTVSSNVNPVALTISGLTAVSKSYDGSTSAGFSGTPQYAGLVNGENFAVTGTPVASFADAFVGVNKAVIVSGFNAPSANYSLTQPTLTASINANSVTISSTTNSSDLTNLAGADVTVANAELTIDANTVIHKLTLNADAKLSINDNKTLNILSDLLIQSNASGTGTIVDLNAGGGLSVAGTTSVQQFLSSARNWYISSPVAAARAKSGFTYYSRDEANDSWTTLATGDGVTTGDLFTVGKGYVANLSSGSAVYTFNGTLNSGTQSITLYRTAAQVNKPGFNLVGNPYASYVNAGTVLNSTANLEKTIWYRTQIKNSSSYTFDTYNTLAGLGINNSRRNAFVTGTVAPMQSFWVRVADGQPSATLTFLNSYRSHATDTVNILKSKTLHQPENQIVRLELSNAVNTDEALLYSNAGASDGCDSYDSPKINTNSALVPELYFPLGAQQLAINGMNSIPYGTEIALGFSTLAEGQFSIRASQFANFGKDAQLILKDYQNPVSPVISDISDGRAYSFSSGISTNNTSRFTIILRASADITGISQPGSGEPWISTDADGRIIVNNSFTALRVDVYNAVGQRMTSEVLKSGSGALKNRFVPGVYFITLNNATKCYSTKVVLK